MQCVVHCTLNYAICNCRKLIFQVCVFLPLQILMSFLDTFCCLPKPSYVRLFERQITYFKNLSKHFHRFAWWIVQEFRVTYFFANTDVAYRTANMRLLLVDSSVIQKTKITHFISHFEHCMHKLRLSNPSWLLLLKVVSIVSFPGAFFLNVK